MSPDEQIAYQLVMQDRERILRAFIAETGFPPSECIQITAQLKDGSYAFLVRRITEEEKKYFSGLQIKEG